MSVSSNQAEDFTWSVVDALARERRRQGLSLEEVADRASVHRTSLGLIERHKRGVTLNVAARLAWALGLDLAALVSLAEGELGDDVARRSDDPGGIPTQFH